MSVASLILATALAAEPDARGDAFFESKVRPVLVEHCLRCHSGDKAKGGLRLDSRAASRKGGDSGPAIVPGQPEKSLLIAAIEHTDDVASMPPGQKLPASVVADLRTWVTMGAADPRDRPMPVSVAKPWALQPVRATEPPSVRDMAWPRGAIDYFVLAPLEAAGHRPAADADRRSLARRLSFDLLGLPPTPEEVEAFVADRSPDAYERLVDGWLASPAFGEAWGRHWLDVARFAESAGRTMNIAWPHAWRYRDYVVRSFNDDKPYDRFLREQIAGDLLPTANTAERDAGIVATGFLALGPKPFEEGGQLEKFRLETADEQIDVIGRAVLGLTLACARCHDHKFDPITRADYYALAGVFLSTDTLYGPGPAHPGHKIYGTPLVPIGPDAARLHGPYQAHVDAVRDQQNALGKARSDRYRHVRNLDSLQLKRKAAPGDDAAKLDETIAAEKAKIAEWDATIAAIQKRLTELQAAPPPAPAYAMAVAEAAQAADCAIRVRGEWKDKGPVVPRGLPPSLSPPVAIAAEESGRRQLAEWLTRPDHPLTARVVANRVWQHLFGRGLVRTSDNFGATGEPPSHPALLDHLADRLVRHGWSLKRLVRAVVLSRTYQLGPDATLAAADPDNRLFGRHGPRRLTAESLRDAILAVAGGLERTPPVGSRVMNGVGDSAGSLQQPVPGENDRPVRAVYLSVVRSQLPEMLPLFDFPDPSLVSARRDERTMPQQGLYLLNSPFVDAQAKRLAGRLLATPGDAATRIDRAYRLCCARPATSAEVTRAVAFLGGSDGPAAWTELSRALLASAEFRYVE